MLLSSASPLLFPLSLSLDDAFLLSCFPVSLATTTGEEEVLPLWYRNLRILPDCLSKFFQSYYCMHDFSLKEKSFSSLFCTISLSCLFFSRRLNISHTLRVSTTAGGFFLLMCFSPLLALFSAHRYTRHFSFSLPLSSSCAWRGQKPVSGILDGVWWLRSRRRSRRERGVGRISSQVESFPPPFAVLTTSMKMLQRLAGWKRGAVLSYFSLPRCFFSFFLLCGVACGRSCMGGGGGEVYFALPWLFLRSPPV